MADAVKELVSAARAAEARGEVAAACEQYLKAGFPEEAARVLMAQGQFIEAGRVYTRAAEQFATKGAKGEGDRKRLSRSAAVCFARGGDARRAVELFVAVGDTAKAIEVLERAGDARGAARLRAGQPLAPDPKSPRAAGASASSARRETGARLEQEGRLDLALEAFIAARLPADAARVARKLERHGEAAKLYEDAATFYEAAVCWLEAGEKQRCLEAIIRMSPQHKMYRACCARAIAIADELSSLSMELDQFLSRFTASAPESDADVQAFARLGKLYEDEGFADSAQDIYRKLLAQRPDHPVKERLAQLDASSGASKAYAKILGEDVAFMGKAPARATRMQASAGADPLAALDELPPLPAREPRAPAPQARPGTIAGVPNPVNAAPAMPAVVAARPFHGGDLRAGDVIADRYRIEAAIGEGGMAAIFRALDTELDDLVAIKVFTLPTQDPEVLQRFKQELAVARKLSHPNVVRLHDIGVHQGCRFITMELLAGEDLGKLLSRERMTLARALELLSQACAGLQVAHDRGVIHRDIKPENLFLTHEGVLKVMDFGIAKDTNITSKTRTGMIAGTPAYMSPEQITGFARVTPLTDIYALGIVAYQMCTGDVPFSHAEMMPTLMMHVQQPPDPPKRRNAQLPAVLNDLILKLLEKEPEKRVQTCRELAVALDEIRARLRS
jgi:tetratricopeptide (TPR) repeat protein